MKMNFDIEDFTKTYKGTKKFTEENDYFAFFIKSLKEDGELFAHIKFCNDVLNIPPILVFVRYHKEKFDREMEVYEKRSLGACFGYLFQFMLGYKQSISTWVGDRKTGIKNASYFKK